MDMQIDSDKIRRLRKKRFYSQEELAIACGLGLRTIQRMESEGKGSTQTLKAIASVLQVQPEELDLTHSRFRGYHNLQLGTWLILVILLASGLIIWQFSINNLPPNAFLAMLLVDAVIAATFATLTIQVSSECITWRLGLGLIHKSIPLSEIEHYSVVKNKLWWGLGIRKIERGWLYAVSGLDAVELELSDGRIVRIGTDEPDALNDAITRAWQQ